MIVRDAKIFYAPIIAQTLWICDNLHNDCNLTSSICTYNTHTKKTYMFDDQNQVQDLYEHLPMLNFFDFHYLTRQVLLNNSINLLAHLPFPQTCIWIAKACTKTNPMHDPHLTPYHENKNQKLIV